MLLGGVSQSFAPGHSSFAFGGGLGGGGWGGGMGGMVDAVGPKWATGKF